MNSFLHCALCFTKSNILQAYTHTHTCTRIHTLTFTFTNTLGRGHSSFKTFQVHDRNPARSNQDTLARSPWALGKCPFLTFSAAAHTSCPHYRIHSRVLPERPHRFPATLPDHRHHLCRRSQELLYHTRVHVDTRIAFWCVWYCSRWFSFSRVCFLF